MKRNIHSPTFIKRRKQVLWACFLSFCTWVTACESSSYQGRDDVKVIKGKKIALIADLMTPLSDGNFFMLGDLYVEHSQLVKYQPSQRDTLRVPCSKYVLDQVEDKIFWDEPAPQFILGLLGKELNQRQDLTGLKKIDLKTITLMNRIILERADGRPVTIACEKIYPWKFIVME